MDSVMQTLDAGRGGSAGEGSPYWKYCLDIVAAQGRAFPLCDRIAQVGGSCQRRGVQSPQGSESLRFPPLPVLRPP